MCILLSIITEVYFTNKLNELNENIVFKTSILHLIFANRITSGILFQINFILIE